MGDFAYHARDPAHGLLIKWCREHHVNITNAVEKAILEMVAKGSTDPEVKAALIAAKYERLKAFTDLPKRMLSFINFYDGYSEKSKTEMLNNLPNIDEEYKELIDGVFTTGRERADGMKADLRAFLECLKQIKSDNKETQTTTPEPKPLSLGRKPKYAHPEVNSSVLTANSTVETPSKPDLMKKYGLSEKAWELAVQYSTAEGYSIVEAIENLLQASEEN